MSSGRAEIVFSDWNFMSVSAAQLYDLYLAYFGRPPDPAGMRYYLEGNFQLEDVLRGFSASPESVTLNGSAFGAAQVNAIYQNLFNRDAEPAGLAYWQNEVASGRLTPAAAALGILQGAQNADLASVQNKVTVARAFVEQLDTDRELAGYSGANAAALARAFLKTVDSSASSVTAAQTALPAQVGLASGTATPPGGGSSPPPVFGASKDGGDIVSFSAAGAQIDATEAGGTWTFTSGTSTATVTGTVAGYVVPASTTLSISSVLASGKVFSGTGTGLVVANTAGENLTAFNATGVDGFQLATGQNYTLTAAQAAIGRIGAAGAAGSLTDAGTITVRDTLAALGNGVAATLKTNGVDSIIASTTAGADISAITVAGIDSIVLVAGIYTMTAAQAALADATNGTQAVTLTTQASGTLTATVESFALGNFANAVTLGAGTQGVTSPGGTATSLTIGGLTASGDWALAHTGDTLVATTGANISGINSGAVTTAENLTLTGAITMTRAQHAGFTGTVSASGGTDSVTITTNGTVIAKAGVETYIVAQAGTPNTVSVSAAAGGVNITGGTGAATVVIDASTTATGNWSLASTGDSIGAFDGVNISGVNSGAATTAETLTVNGAISMTQAQHQAFTTVTATGGSDAVTITDGGAVTARAGIETYSLSGGGANNLTVLAGGTLINGASANATTVTVGSNTVSGTWSLANALDTIVVSGGSISGVNSGLATTAEKLILTGGVIMTQAQAAGLTDVTAAGGSDFITITTGGAVTARAGVETYTVSSVASNNVSVLAATRVNGVADNATTVSVAGNTVTGVYTLSNAADVLDATTGANIAGATTSSVERLVLTGTVTMTANQYSVFNTGGITATGGSDRIILTTALSSATLNPAVENFTLAAGSNSFALGAVQAIDAQALSAGQSLTVAGAFAATVALGAANLSASGASGVLTVTGGAGANTIEGGSGADILNGGDGNDIFMYASMAPLLSANSVFDRISGDNGIDTVEIAGAITLTTSTDLTRITTVEQMTARSQSSAQNVHSIAIGSDFLLGDLRVIDLSSDTKGTPNASSATIDLSTVSKSMTLKGVGVGSNTISAGTGADTLVGGTGDDLFLFNTAAHATGDTVTGGGGTDTVLFRSSTAGETLVVGNTFSAGLSYLITAGSTAGASTGTTAANIDASSHTQGGVNLTGNAGNNILQGSSFADTLAGGGGNDTVRGGAGSDFITTSTAGTVTYVFEGTGSANGNDTLAGVRADHIFNFSAFLGTSVAKRAAVEVNTTTPNPTIGLDLTTGSDNIGFRYGTSNLSTANILLATDNTVVGEVAVRDNGKAVVFSFSSGSSSNSATGNIYYVDDTESAIGVVNWRVTAIGSITSSTTDIGTFASSFGPTFL